MVEPQSTRWVTGSSSARSAKMTKVKCGRSVAVTRHPSKVNQVGPTPIARSIFTSWTLSDFQAVANRYVRNVIQVVLGDAHCQANGTEEYLNHSYIASPNIYLGIYDDEELKLASFFHELGHVLVPKDFAASVEYYSPDVEREAWRIGFEVAKNEHGLEFSQKAHEWAEGQIQTYVEGWEREQAFTKSRKIRSNADSAVVA